MRDPEARNKAKVPVLSHLPLLLSISNRYSWADLVMPYLEVSRFVAATMDRKL